MKLRDAEDDNESIVKLLNKEFKEILQNVNKNNLNHTLQEKNVSYQTQRLNKKLQGSIINVPVYDIEFTKNKIASHFCKAISKLNDIKTININL